MHNCYFSSTAVALDGVGAGWPDPDMSVCSENEAPATLGPPSCVSAAKTRVVVRAIPEAPASTVRIACLTRLKTPSAAETGEELLEDTTDPGDSPEVQS